MNRITILLLTIAALTILACKKPTPRMEGYQVHGIDVSHHQGEISWNVIDTKAYHFAFIKATEGETHQDSNFVKNWNAIGCTKMKRGAYHFFRPEVPVKNQVANYLRTVPLSTGDLPPVLDVEISGDLSEEKVVSLAFEWMTEVERLTGVKPIFYTYQKFFNKNLLKETVDFPLWIARYNSLPPELGNQAKWQFWQYGNRGEIEGIEGYVDFNVFKGKPADLDAMLICLEEKP